MDATRFDSSSNTIRLRTSLTVLGIALALAGLRSLFAGSFGLAAQAADARPVVVTPDPEQVFRAEFGTIRFLVTGEQTKGAFAVMEGIEQQYATGLHRHPFDESFYVVEGTLTVHVSGDTRRIPAGSYVFIPRGVPHAQGNLEETPVKSVLTVTPAGFENSFRDRVERFRRAKQGTPEWDRLTVEMQKRAEAGGYRVERLGDTPFER